MIDRLFTAILTFCILATGTAAIAQALLEGAPQKTEHCQLRLPDVAVVGKRATVAQALAVAPGTARVQ